MISPQVLHFTHKPLGISCFFVLVSEIFGFSFSSNTAMTNLLPATTRAHATSTPANTKTLTQLSSIAPVGKHPPLGQGAALSSSPSPLHSARDGEGHNLPGSGRP